VPDRTGIRGKTAAAPAPRRSLPARPWSRAGFPLRECSVRGLCLLQNGFVFLSAVGRSDAIVAMGGTCPPYTVPKPAAWLHLGLVDSAAKRIEFNQQEVRARLGTLGPASARRRAAARRLRRGEGSVMRVRRGRRTRRSPRRRRRRRSAWPKPTPGSFADQAFIHFAHRLSSCFGSS